MWASGTPGNRMLVLYCRKPQCKQQKMRSVSAAVLWAINCNQAKIGSNGVFKKILIDEKHAQVKALIDSGSTHSFITAERCKPLSLYYRAIKFHTPCKRRAVPKSRPVRHLSFDWPVLLLSNFLGRHGSCPGYNSQFGRSFATWESRNAIARTKTSANAIWFFYAAVMKAPNEFPAMKIDPPELFNEVYIYVETDRYSEKNWKQDSEFIVREIVRLLEWGVIEPSFSLGRTQAFVVHGHKHRMVIDNSKTVNKKPDSDRLTSLKEFPNPTDAKKPKRLLGFFGHHANWLNKYSEEIKPFLECMEQKCFPLPNVVCVIRDLKMQIRGAAISSTIMKSGCLLLETDASESVIGSALFLADRPLAFFSRVLSWTEQTHSVVEKEALAIVVIHKVLKFHQGIFNQSLDRPENSCLPVLKSQIKDKNEKLFLWRLELSRCP